MIYLPEFLEKYIFIFDIFLQLINGIYYFFLHFELIGRWI